VITLPTDSTDEYNLSKNENKGIDIVLVTKSFRNDNELNSDVIKYDHCTNCMLNKIQIMK